MILHGYRIHPLWRLGGAAVLGWVAWTCLAFRASMVVVVSIPLALICAFILRGLGRRFGGYLQTWKG